MSTDAARPSPLSAVPARSAARPMQPVTDPAEWTGGHLLRLWLATPDGRPLPQFYHDRYGTLAPGGGSAGIECAATRLSTPLQPE